MNKPAVVRIKGAKWETFAGEDSSDPQSTGLSTVSRKSHEENDPGTNNAQAMLLDLTLRHFRAAQLTAAEAKRLSSALRCCLKKGEAVDVGPVGTTGRIYSFRRRVNAIAIRAGQGCIRLPLEAAKALIKPLQGAVSPRIFAKAS